jgi:YVTN family beta-propeller protein
VKSILPYWVSGILQGPPRKAVGLGLPALCALGGWLLLSGLSNGHAEDPASQAGLKPLLRHPVALVVAEEKWLFTANERSGTVSVLDLERNQTVAEVPVGRKLADLVAIPDRPHLLAVDEEANELILLSRQGTDTRPVQRLKVSPAPVSVRVSPDGKLAAVASLWSRRLTLVDLTGPRILRTVDLPFAPRQQLLVEGGKKLIVADSFGGQLAVVDLPGGELKPVRSLLAHNIRGLALSADGSRLLVSHQELNPLAQAQRDDIHWGNLITNNVRVLSLAAVLDPKADLLRGSDLLHLGDVGRGTGDPAGVAVTGPGQLIVALAGVDEIAIGNGQGRSWDLVSVGRRPTMLRPSADGRHVYVANTFSDSVSVVDLQNRKLVKELPLGPRSELTASDRGELLFYDARLSHDRWLSCHSCHSDGHTNGLLADTLGDGTYGTPKRTLSLRGVSDTGPWAWNGGMPDLATQIRKSIESTLAGTKPTPEQVQDLEAYLRTLAPAPALARLRGKVDDDQVRQGREVFAKQACAKCHTPGLYTSSKTYDVGLSDERGQKMFNPPSLRGVSQGGPYFHDGRAKTLTAVFVQHRHQVSSDLTSQEAHSLVQFLATL